MRNSKLILLCVLSVFFILSIARQSDALGDDPSRIACYDADGQNFYLKSSLTGLYNYSDYCASSTVLYEQLCDPDMHPSTYVYTCPYGCSDGACVQNTCTDSDGGKNYNSKGTASGPNNPSATDFCITYSDSGVLSYEQMRSKGGSNALIEHYCDQYGYVANEPYLCQNGCSDGACLPTKCEIYSVYFKQVPGYAYSYMYIDGVSIPDSGLYGITGADSWNSLQFRLDSTSRSMKSLVSTQTLNSAAVTYIQQRIANIKLTYGNSVCEQRCTDTDGGKAYNVKGTVSYNGFSYVDSCNSNTQLNEQYCDPIDVANAGEVINCPYGCSGGVCLSAPVCGNGLCEDGEKDVCPACTTQPCPSMPCKSGSCPSDCASSCTDSDGGLNYAVKGYSQQGANDAIQFDSCATYDYCSYGGTCSTGEFGYHIGDLVERICYPYGWKSTDGQRSCTIPGGCSAWFGYKCPNGCLDGACVQGLPDLTTLDFTAEKTSSPFADTYAVNFKVTSKNIGGVKTGSIYSMRINTSAGYDYPTAGWTGSATTSLQLNPGSEQTSTVGSYLWKYKNFPNLDIYVTACADMSPSAAYNNKIQESNENNNCFTKRVTMTQTTCTDTDGGFDYGKKGYVSFCRDLDGQPPYDSVCSSYFDGCMSSSTTKLYEQYCDANSVAQQVVYDCPGGCKDGACIQNTDTCVDTDGGRNYYVSGSTSYCPSNLPSTQACAAALDSCSGETLKENYCDGITVKSEYYVCPDGCSAGACLNIKTADMQREPVKGGQDAKVKIIAYLNYFETYSPNAWNVQKSLFENYGDRISLEFRNFPLWNNHFLGAEAAECAFALSDDATFFRFSDSVFSELHPAYALDSTLKGKLIDIAGRVGIDKTKFTACLDAGKFKPEVEDDVAKGKLMGVQGLPVFFVNGNIEQYSYDHMKEVIDSLLGTQDACKDTDGGKNYYVKGTMSGHMTSEGLSVTDSCQDGSTLVENYCTGNYGNSEKYFCQYGCIDGACLQDAAQAKDYLKFEKEDNKFNLNDNIAMVWPEGISNGDVSFMESGVFSDNVGDTRQSINYLQMLSFAKSKIAFKYTDPLDEGSDYYLEFPSGGNAYVYGISFGDGGALFEPTKVKSDFAGTKIRIYGKEYTIIDASVDTGSRLDSLTLISGDNDVWLSQDQPYTVGDHTVTVIDTSGDASQCGVEVDGVVKWIDVLTTEDYGDISIGVLAVKNVASTNNDQDTCKLSLGAKEVVLENLNKVIVNDVESEGSYVTMTGTAGHLMRIEIQYTLAREDSGPNSDDIYLRTGESWVDPVFGEWVILFDRINQNSGATDMYQEPTADIYLAKIGWSPAAQCRIAGERCGRLAGQCCPGSNCIIAEDAPYAAGTCVNEVKNDFTYRITTDKQIYNKGDTIQLRGIVKGNNIEGAAVRAWVVSPNGNTQKVEMTKEACGTGTGDNKRCIVGQSCTLTRQCTFTGKYVLGGDYPLVTIGPADEDVLSRTQTEVAEVSTDAITANVVAEDKKTMPPGIKSRYYVNSVASAGGSLVGAKTFFFTWENKENVNLLLNDQYKHSENVAIVVQNSRDAEITYMGGCIKPYDIEMYVKGKGYVAVDNNPCLDRCQGSSLIKIAPGESAQVGQWDQRVYDGNCRESQAGQGLYRAVFRYGNSKSEAYTATKEFKIVSSDGCSPICKAVGTGSEGWYDSCTGELIKYDPCNDKTCDGCQSGGKCLPYGTRIAKADSADGPAFCDMSSAFVLQKLDGAPCQNNYECQSNSCNSGTCSDLQKELSDTRNLIQKIWDWLRGKKLA